MFVALDRDGTLISHVPYLESPEQIRIDTSAAYGIRRLNELSIPVVVITNQPVIGRGLVSRKKVDEIHDRISIELAMFGAYVHGYFVCPHSADGECDCRKPKPKLVVDAAAYLGFRTGSCVVIGDSWRDMQLARQLGVRGLHVRTGPDTCHEPSDESFPDVLCAVNHLLQTSV